MGKAKKQVSEEVVAERADGVSALGVDPLMQMGIDPSLRMPDVERATGLGRGFIYRLIQRGEFPAPFKMAARASAWRASEIRAWLQKQHDASGSPKAS